MVHHPAFAADDDLSGTPTNVVKLERDNFASAQAESSKQKQDRVVAAPTEGRSRYRQYMFYFAGREKCGRHGLAIFAEHGNGIREVPRGLAA
jgi:hypothetical protein